MQRKIPPARCDCGGSQEVWDQVLHRVPRFAPSNYQGYQQGVPFFWQVLLHGLGRLPPDAVSTALNIPLLFILHNLFLINVKKLVYAFKTTILNRTKNGRRNIPQNALLVEKTPQYLNTLGAPQAIAKVNIKKSSRQKQKAKAKKREQRVFLLVFSWQLKARVIVILCDPVTRVLSDILSSAFINKRPLGEMVKLALDTRGNINTYSTFIYSSASFFFFFFF